MNSVEQMENQCGQHSLSQEPLTDAQKQELDRRFEYDELHPETFVVVEEFMSKYSF